MQPCGVEYDSAPVGRNRLHTDSAAAEVAPAPLAAALRLLAGRHRECHHDCSAERGRLDRSSYKIPHSCLERPHARAGEFALIDGMMLPSQVSPRTHARTCHNTARRNAARAPVTVREANVSNTRSQPSNRLFPLPSARRDCARNDPRTLRYLVHPHRKFRTGSSSNLEPAASAAQPTSKTRSHLATQKQVYCRKPLLFEHLAAPAFARPCADARVVDNMAGASLITWQVLPQCDEWLVVFRRLSHQMDRLMRRVPL